ncbi:polysaccharide deacetylase family protein [Ideonella sp.]|uniref:polysaccharide deacetylase family protein n=1 Tax=Ideonella sp. TaxID=1929293 RepID=UPI002B47D07C|nr:polysaccharide deacetylase family protein [Ideonella sp.]HJV71477.1 polysaccharide deacetylase family protein [Ideonella sp.]
MTPERRRFLAALGWSALAGPGIAARAAMPTGARVPVLVYHRFAPTVEDGMTLRLSTFDGHLRVLRELGCRIVPLADVVAWRQGRLPELPAHAVALSADDAHRSQFEHMAPRLRETGWPMTLFVYPSAVSNAPYAMRWEELAALQASGFRIESHTYWHPHLVRERRQQAPADFERFATDQLVRSRARLHERLGATATLLAWPFGMTDDGLMALAARLGYEAAFALGNRPVARADPLHALPRHLMTDAMSPGRLARLLEDAFATPNTTTNNNA